MPRKQEEISKMIEYNQEITTNILKNRFLEEEQLRTSQKRWYNGKTISNNRGYNRKV